MSDDGRLRGKMLAPLEFQATMQDNGASTITFSTSELAASKLTVPFVVSLVGSTNGGPHSRLRSGEFIITDSDADDADRAKKVTFSGMEFVPWLLSMNRQHWSSSAKNGTRTWLVGKNATSVGYLMSGLIAEGQARGWGELLSIGFNGTTDSNGAAWTASERQSEAWPLLMPVSEILQRCADNGLCDWYCEGTTLEIVRPGTGPLRSNITLGGPLFTSRPVRSSFKDVFTHLTVVPEKARNWLYLTNTGATSRFGRLEASQTQSGVDDHATATKNAQPALTMGRATKNEVSFDWSPDAGGPTPWFEFNIGDTVWTKTRAGKSVQRVIGLQVSRVGQDPVTVRAITGDKLVGTATRLARKTNAVSVGGTTGGTGVALPSSNGATFPVPAAPTGLHVESNVSQWGADGSALTGVTLAWDAVSQAEDGSGVDVEAYQVAVRSGATPSSVAATTDALSWTATGWPVNVQRMVRVRAVAPNGDKSAWSDEIPVTPVDPARPVKVTGLAVTSQTGSWRADGTAQTDVVLAWDAVSVDTGGNVIPVTYEVSSRLPVKTDAVVDSTTVTVSDWEPGTTRYVKVRAVSGNGKGDWSDELTVAVQVPSSIVPKAPVGVAVSSNTGVFLSDGRAVATVTVGWSAVTQSVDDTPVTVTEYEVTAGDEVQRVTGLTASFTVPSGVAAGVRVRALTSLGVWGDPSTVLNVTGALPAVLTVVPSAPVLTPGMGGVAYRWDGLSSTGGVMPVGFNRIVVDTAASATGPWTTLGASGDSGSIAADVGTEVFVRFRVLDTLGRAAGTSTVASAVAAGVALGDIPGLEADLDGIRFTADGKNRVYTQKDSPGENMVANGSFEDGTAQLYTVRRNLATIGKPAALGSVTVVNDPVWDGDTWIGQVTASAVGHGVRLDMNALTAEIPNGSTLYAEWEVGNPGSSPVTVNVDSADGATVAKTLAPGERARVGTSYSRADYTTIYRFSDLAVMEAGRPVVYRNIVADTAPLVGYGNGGVSPDSDLTPSWAGTPGASVSLFSAPRTVGYFGSASTAFQSGQWAKTGSKSLRIVSTWATRGSAYVDLMSNAMPGIVPGDVLTVFATARRDQVHPFTNTAYISAALVPGATSEFAPNEPGEHPLRLTFTVPTGSWYLRFYNGGMIGDPDIWFDDLLVVKADVDKPPFTQGDLWLQLDPSGASVIAVKVWNGTAWAPQVLYAESIIATESITAPLIRAGAIEVNHVSPSFGDDLNLEANGSINLLVGRVDANQDALNEQQATLGQQAAGLAAAQAAADAAASGASSAGIAAAAAKAAADAAQAGVNEYGKVFAFETDGFSISAPLSPVSFLLSNDYAAIRRDGVAKTTWTETEMIVPKLKAAQVVVGKTVITEKPDGMTWQRL